MGWRGTKNGALLALVEGRFDAFLTGDQSIPMQQKLAGRGFGLVVLAARTNRLEDLLPLVPAALDALRTLSPGQVVTVAAP